MYKKLKFTNFSLFVSCIAAIGGLLFGFNTSIISGALIFIAHDFGLTTFQQELAVSTLLIGALIGALIGGFIADYLGRKKTLFLTLALFFIGTVTVTLSVHFGILLLGRLISGLAVGIVSMAVPLYIAEMSPAEKRGAQVSINQLAITIGILIAYIVSYSYADEAAWRSMFKFSYILIIIQFIGLFFVPESPSWLFTHGKKESAEKILHQLRVADPQQPLVGISKEEDRPTKKDWKELLTRDMRKPFLIGIGVAVLQSITGINTVIYYAPNIFKEAGFHAAQTALLATVLVGVVNVAVTIVSLWLIDRLGRRTLLLGGLSGMAISLLLLALSFLGEGKSAGYVSVVALQFFVAFFAVSLGPVTWVLISEVFPLGIRGRAMGIATFANWTCNYIVALTFLSLIGAVGIEGTFCLYAFICLLGLWFVIKCVPETKGKTFDQIQSFWKNS